MSAKPQPHNRSSGSPCKRRSLVKWIALIYAVAMVISVAVRHLIPAETGLSQGQRHAWLKPHRSADGPVEAVRTAYYDHRSKAKTQNPVVLLIHGPSKAARQTFENLVPLLTGSARVIAPDLPGFGASTRRLKDYSASTQARYMLALMDELGVGKAHLVGYRTGAAVALNMAYLAPRRIGSITMLSAVGVQEFGLLGQYHLNRSLYAAQLVLSWSIINLLPHAGMLDGLPFNVSYARTVYDTDQRPLRDYLAHYRSPMLILHGRSDPLVPRAAAHEHHRLVPQSRLKLYSGDHRLLARQVETVGKDINRFIRQVETGRAPGRANARPERILNAGRPFSRAEVQPARGLTLVVIMVLIALATLVSEDLTCIGAGLMVARGTIGFFPATAAAFIGIFAGDILLYLAGRYLGRPALQLPPFRWLIKEDDWIRTSRWFKARGPTVIIASRFLPGSRLPTYFGAGVLGTGFWMFAFFFSMAAALWTPLLVGLSTVIGSRAMALYDAYHQYALPATIATVGLIWLAIRLIVPLFTYRGRRLLLSGLLRKIHWEFWPPMVFYPPVVLYVIWLGIRRRCLTLFTATNPGIPESGFVGESKSRILEQLKTERTFIARYRLISAALPAEARIAAAGAFMRSIDTGFPIVLKPDVGQRGSGVRVIKNRRQLEAYLSSAAGDTIIQEYVSGREYGVFYYRMPGQRQGQIFSITDKRLLTLTGDGASTLEKLILSDPRAVCMARFHLRQHADELYRVPEKNEVVPLVQVGTHARGALFLDGMSILTEPMQAAIDRISRGFAGFYFGRYDIRTPDPDDFKKGRNFKIVELNGVTSEATHIYDPQNSLWQAYRVLMRQWQIAVAIGAANKARGQVPMTPAAFLNLVIRHQRIRNPAAFAAGEASKNPDCS